MKIHIKDLMSESGVNFGTSGVRGLVNDMTDIVCFVYVSAFLKYLSEQGELTLGDKIGIAGDLRASTPRIINAAVLACQKMGFESVFFGFIPSPAIAFFGISHEMPTIMVTGSHIPDDRNGIKFNTPSGEILKQDEAAIRLQCVELDDSLFNKNGYFVTPIEIPEVSYDAYDAYIHRYVSFFPAGCLQGKRIGLYEHSSVARDVFKEVLENLGASVTSLGRSETFIPVDTEAIRPEDIAIAQKWAQQDQFDCIVSTDGDGDRPLISNEKGQWLRGDIAGILCARYLNADNVITPVSCNSAVEKSEFFSRVIRTKIGSPFVICAMQELEKESSGESVVGYEANGGFLQQTDIVKDGNVLSPLPTRDAIIVALAVVLSASEKNSTISELVNSLPERYTYSDRLKNFPTKLSQEKLADFISPDIDQNKVNIYHAFPDLSQVVSIDDTDGVRITLQNEDIVHLRPSGNAPELRCYTESSSEVNAKKLNELCMAQMQLWNS